MQSILQILKVNDPRSGTTKDGRPWQMQDAECILLKDTGEVDQVGVLRIPKELNGKVAPGTYLGSFGLKPNYKDRTIEAVLVGLQPYEVKRPSAKG